MEPPKIYTTSEWGARPVDETFPWKSARGIVLHNTASPNRPAKKNRKAGRDAGSAYCRSVQAFHMDTRGWADTGQHFTISREGDIFEGRHGSLAAARVGKVVRGAHAGNATANQTWFGIEVEGSNEDDVHITDAQWKSLIELCAWLFYWSKTDTQNIKGHQEWTDTDCPGKLMERLPALREAAHHRKVELLAAHA